MKRITKNSAKKIRHYLRVPKILFQYGLNDCSNTDRYIFHHLPKCGGTSVVDALTNWFVVLKDYPSGWSAQNDPSIYQEFCDRPKDLDKVKPYQILTGHYHVDGSFIDRRDPDWQTKGYRLFTILQDPLELQI